jgi:hypothetical protein
MYTSMFIVQCHLKKLNFLLLKIRFNIFQLQLIWNVGESEARIKNKEFLNTYTRLNKLKHLKNKNNKKINWKFIHGAVFSKNDSRLGYTVSLRDLCHFRGGAVSQNPFSQNPVSQNLSSGFTVKGERRTRIYYVAAASRLEHKFNSDSAKQHVHSTFVHQIFAEQLTNDIYVKYAKDGIHILLCAEGPWWLPFKFRPP